MGYGPRLTALLRLAYALFVALADIVVVSYNSRTHLRDSVSPLAHLQDINVIVVDNASVDGSLESISDLPVTLIQRADNAGFAAGCNAGWRAGHAPYVLFLNPDATLNERSLRTLVGSLEADETLGAVAPRIEHPDGSIAWSQRRFPRLRSTYARALFLHRLLPRATWTDELVRDPSRYNVPASPDWLSGACLLVRRTALKAVGGWDEGFFLYGEDIDLCRRLRERGYELAFEPTARAVHVEGASSARGETLPLLAASRIRYGYKHRGRVAATVEQLGVGLEAATHLIAARGGRASRAGHLRALRAALSRPIDHTPGAGAT